MNKKYLLFCGFWILKFGAMVFRIRKSSLFRQKSPTQLKTVHFDGNLGFR